MQARLLVPAMLAAFTAIASAQNTAPNPEAEAAQPAPTAPADAAKEPSAVATAAPAASAAAKAAPQQRCHKEYPLGSNLPKTVCESPVDPDLDQMRIRALDDLKNTVRPGLRGVGGG